MRQKSVHPESPSERLLRSIRRLTRKRHSSEEKIRIVPDGLRGVDQTLARQVAQQLMTKDALTAHACDELGISESTTARPMQAALTSAATFSTGAAMPLLMVVVSPANLLVPIVFAASLGFLALLGAIGAKAGGANVLRATARVTFWGALAMVLAAGIGKLFGAVTRKLDAPAKDEVIMPDCGGCRRLYPGERPCRSGRDC